jgi:hypothetical protein
MNKCLNFDTVFQAVSHFDLDTESKILGLLATLT